MALSRYFFSTYLKKLRKNMKISGQTVSGPRFQLRTSQICSRSANYYTMTFGVLKLRAEETQEMLADQNMLPSDFL
jgi:hypothetical protein